MIIFALQMREGIIFLYTFLLPSSRYLNYKNANLATL